MKTYSLTYNHITGSPNNYSTTHLSQFFDKLEKVMDDRNVIQSSITLNTVEQEVTFDEVPKDFEYFAPKHKLFHDKN